MTDGKGSGGGTDAGGGGPAPAGSLDREHLVSVREAPDESTATMLRDFLQGQGIEAAAVPVQIPWFGTIETVRHGYWGRVEVLERDAQRARELIEDFFAAVPEMESPPGPEGEDS